MQRGNEPPHWTWYGPVAIVVLSLCALGFIGIVVWVIAAGINPALLFVIGVPLAGFGAVAVGRIVVNRKNDDG